MSRLSCFYLDKEVPRRPAAARGTYQHPPGKPRSEEKRQWAKMDSRWSCALDGWGIEAGTLAVRDRSIDQDSTVNLNRCEGLFLPTLGGCLSPWVSYSSAILEELAFGPVGACDWPACFPLGIGIIDNVILADKWLVKKGERSKAALLHELMNAGPGHIKDYCSQGGREKHSVHLHLRSHSV